MGLWDDLKKGVENVGSWLGQQGDKAWSKIPEFRTNIDVKVDAKIQFDSADIRIGLEAVGRGLDSIGAGLQTGLSEVGHGIGVAGISAGQGLQLLGGGVGSGLAAIGQGIHDFDPTGGLARKLVEELDRAKTRLRAVTEIQHYLETLGDPMAGDHLSFRFRNESDLVKTLKVDARFVIGNSHKNLQFEMNQTPRPNELHGWEQVINIPYAYLRSHNQDALPYLEWIEAIPTEEPYVSKYQEARTEARKALTRVSVDVFRVTDSFEHYTGGGTYVWPRKRPSLEAAHSPSVIPDRINFEKVTVNIPKPRDVTISNPTDLPITVHLESSNPTVFKIAPSDTLLVPKASSSTFTVIFTPSQAISYSAELTVTFISSSWEAKHVPLNGDGEQPVGPLPSRRPLAAAGPCTLDGDLSGSDKTWAKVSDGQFFDYEWRFCVTIEQEKIICAGSNDRPHDETKEKERNWLYILYRGYDGTAAAAHRSGSAVSLSDTTVFVDRQDPQSVHFHTYTMAMGKDMEKLVTQSRDNLIPLARGIFGWESDQLDPLLNKLSELFTNIFGRIDPQSVFFNKIRDYERRFLDSDLLFLVRLGRVLTHKRESENITCKVLATWRRTGGPPVPITREVFIEGDAIVPIPRPVLLDAKRKPIRDWNELELEVQMIEGNALDLEIQVAQVFLTDMRILSTQQGNLTNPAYKETFAVGVYDLG